MYMYVKYIFLNVVQQYLPEGTCVGHIRVYLQCGIAVVGENKPRRAATPFGGGGVDGGAITIGGG